MDALAGCAGCAALVGKGSNSSTSFLQPAEHVGEHQAGVGGWRACGGSGGICGGGTTTGGCIGCGAVAQACSSSSGTVSISASCAAVNLGGIGDLLDGERSAPFLGAGGFDAAGGGGGGLGTLDVQHVLHGQGTHVLGLHAAAVAGGEGGDQQRRRGGELGQQAPGQRDHRAAICVAIRRTQPRP